MRILLISGSLPPMRCGVGDYTDALACALATHPQNQVAVLTSRTASTGHEHAMGGYERLALLDRWTPREARTAWRIVRAWKPDIVHLQFPTLGYRTAWPMLLPIMAWLVGAVAVRTWHEAFLGRRQNALFLVQLAVPGPTIVVRPNFADLIRRSLRPMLRWRRPTVIPGASSIPPSRLGMGERARLRQRYLGGKSRLVAFFGFIHRAKGVDQLFDIAEPASDAIVVAGGVDLDARYVAEIHALAASERWKGQATLTGFLPPESIADLLAAADVVVLPFVDGGGSWNSSISAAVIQGVPVVTTSHERHGLDDTGQVYFGRPNDVADLRAGLADVLRTSTKVRSREDRSDWLRIRDQHMGIYGAALADGRAARRI